MEYWRMVPGFPEYQVSDQGRVKRVAGGGGATPGRILKPWATLGYQYVGLWSGGKQTRIGVHRLVAMAFLSAPKRGEFQVAHADGNRANNTPTNLRWATPIDNAGDRDSHGTGAKGERNPGAKLTPDDVLEIRRRRAAGVMAKNIASAFGLSPGYIWSIVHRKTWAHLGPRA